MNPIRPAGDLGGLIEAGGLVSVRRAPGVEARGVNVGAVGAILKDSQAVIPPGPGQVYAPGGNGGIGGEPAAAEKEAVGLRKIVGGGGHEAHMAAVMDGTELAVFE